MHILGVGDGPRDQAIMEPILCTLAGMRVSVEFKTWKALRVGGYAKAMKFVIREVFDAGARYGGVVAWADDDGVSENRLKQLRDGRNHSAPQFAVKAAVGVAVPHAEAWLLDDAVAIRQTLGLDSTVDVPRVTECAYPKTTLDALVKQAYVGEDVMDALPRIAEALDPTRMTHAKRTGFETFQTDFQEQFGRP
ncbi:MAG: hypothetical protein HY904_04590 [Deltaproteobacteria bacterium]|nr:hypothetical protein [Deltaproteobacteria bacterium]